MRRKGIDVSRRNFMKGTVAGAAALGLGDSIFSPKELAAQTTGEGPVAQSLLAQCPYCGVGCGSVIKADADGRILGVVPDKQHPTNKGVQCIKGLNADEPTYVDRLDRVLVRKDMSDPLRGYQSATKGRFDDDVFEEMSYEEAEHLVVEKLHEMYEKDGGNSIGLYGSGQLTVEAQWLENKVMKGVLESNSIEANARTCMTSAVTGYFATLGSDTPPLCYDDIEESDMITMWGHNARASHTIVFWRIADHKKKNGIPTLVSDPRRTGTVQALESINPRDSFHFQTINGDISCLNALAHVLITEHPDVIDYDFLKANTSGWEEYIKVMKEEYSPEQVIDRTQVPPAAIRAVAKQWAQASRRGKARGRGGVISFLGHRLQPTHSWTA